MAACSYLNSVRAFRGDLSRCAAPFLLPPVLSRCRSLANAIFSAPFSPPLLFSWPYIPAHTYPPPVPPSSPLLLVHLPPPPLLSSPSPHFSPVLSCPLMSGSVAPADVFFLFCRFYPIVFILPPQISALISLRLHIPTEFALSLPGLSFPLSVNAITSFSCSLSSSPPHSTCCISARSPCLLSVSLSVSPV